MPSLRPQTLVINDRKWVAKYSPPKYSGNFMQKGFWYEESYREFFGEWTLSGGGPLYGNITTEEEAMAYLLKQAQKYITIYST